MTSRLAPSPAVMSSLETRATRSAEPLIRWIFLVLPSVTSAPSVNFEECGVLASKAGSFVCFNEKKRTVYHHPDRAANSTLSCPSRQLLKKTGSSGPGGTEPDQRGWREVARAPPVPLESGRALDSFGVGSLSKNRFPLFRDERALTPVFAGYALSQPL